jgi:hypothetical protein
MTHAGEKEEEEAFLDLPAHPPVALLARLLLLRLMPAVNYSQVTYVSTTFPILMGGGRSKRTWH